MTDRVRSLILGIAGLQWKRPLEGVNVFFLLDRSESIPSAQQEAAVKYVTRAARLRRVAVASPNEWLRSRARRRDRRDQICAVFFKFGRNTLSRANTR